jgi:prolyl oligopeptidase
MSVNFALPFAPVEDVLHGVVVRDPYRWLEDRSLPETEQWIREQQRRCAAYFSDCRGLEAIQSRVRNYLDIEVVDQPARVGNRYFYRRRDRGQEQACIYIREVATNEERLLVDPSLEGPFTSVSICRISGDGSLLAYDVKHGGEDRKAIALVDVNRGITLPERLAAGYASGFVFTPNCDGYFYCHETQSDLPEHIIFRHLFQQSHADEIVFRAARTAESRLAVTGDEVHVGALWLHRKDSEIVADFSLASLTEMTEWKKVFSDRRRPYSPILWDGRIFVLSGSETGISRMVELTPNGQELCTIIPEQNNPIRQLLIASRSVYVSQLDQCVPSIRGWSLDGDHPGMVEIPPEGSIQLIGNPSQRATTFFYAHESFAQPPTFFEYASDTNASHLWYRTESPVTTDRCKIRQSSFRSTDGVSIPLTLVSLGNTDLSRPVPVIMTSYGGFGVPMTPQFSVLVTLMMEQGAVFALPHIRGGGEFGRSWHDAGRARNRQTSCEDFTAAAKWLCSEGMTTPQQLGIFGGSNSGLLVAAAMTQRPELFGAVLCIVPLLDMVRYETFDRAFRWRNEYGTVEDPDDFHALYAYSPYHRVREQVDYPPVLFVSGDKDDRCNAAHVRKMAALLQSRDSQRSQIVVDYSEQRGHSPVLPLFLRVEALVHRIAFLCKELKIPMSVGGVDETIRD